MGLTVDRRPRAVQDARKIVQIGPEMPNIRQKNFENRRNRTRDHAPLPLRIDALTLGRFHASLSVLEIVLERSTTPIHNGAENGIRLISMS